jgi:hypothetical protein
LAEAGVGDSGELHDQFNRKRTQHPAKSNTSSEHPESSSGRD